MLRMLASWLTKRHVSRMLPNKCQTPVLTCGGNNYRGRNEMQAKQLVNLIDLVKRLEDRILYEIASCPKNLLRDEEDRMIVQVAAGERAWRLECQK